MMDREVESNMRQKTQSLLPYKMFIKYDPKFDKQSIIIHVSTGSRIPPSLSEIS